VSDNFWEILVFMTGIAVLVIGGSYCRREAEESYRECIKHHAPRDCAEHGQ
jgi:hypothetical protein